MSDNNRSLILPVSRDSDIVGYTDCFCSFHIPFDMNLVKRRRNLVNNLILGQIKKMIDFSVKKYYLFFVNYVNLKQLKTILFVLCQSCKMRIGLTTGH